MPRRRHATGFGRGVAAVRLHPAVMNRIGPTGEPAHSHFTGIDTITRL